jgi:hypothetical protein
LVLRKHEARSTQDQGRYCTAVNCVEVVTFPAPSSVSCFTTMLRVMSVQVIDGCTDVPDTVFDLYFTV